MNLRHPFITILIYVPLDIDLRHNTSLQNLTLDLRPSTAGEGTSGSNDALLLVLMS